MSTEKDQQIDGSEQDDGDSSLHNPEGGEPEDDMQDSTADDSVDTEIQFNLRPKENATVKARQDQMQQMMSAMNQILLNQQLQASTADIAPQNTGARQKTPTPKMPTIPEIPTTTNKVGSQTNNFPQMSTPQTSRNQPTFPSLPSLSAPTPPTAPHTGTPQSTRSTFRSGSAPPIPWKMTFGENENADFNAYLIRFQGHADLAQWDDATKINSVKNTLRGRAGDMVVGMSDQVSWTTFKQQLLDAWEPAERKEVIRELFSMSERGRKERPEAFLQRLRLKAMKAFDRYPTDLRDEIIIKTFIAGQPPAIKSQFAWHRFATEAEALSAVVRAESFVEQERHIDARRSQEGAKNSPRARRRRAAARVAPVDDEASDSDLLQDDYDDDIWLPENVRPEVGTWIRTALTSIETEEDGHYDEDETFKALQAATTLNPEKRAMGICFFCKKPGHRFNKCFRLRDILIKNGMNPNSRPRENSGPPWTKKDEGPKKPSQSGN